MADIKISALPTSPAIASGNVVPYSTGTVTRAAAVNTNNSANTIMIRDASGNVGVNTLNANTVGSTGVTTFYGNGANLTGITPGVNSNGFGTRFIGNANPPSNGIGSDGDIYYQI